MTFDTTFVLGATIQTLVWDLCTPVHCCNDHQSKLQMLPTALFHQDFYHYPTEEGRLTGVWIFINHTGIYMQCL